MTDARIPPIARPSRSPVLEDLTPEDVDALEYVDFISLLRETNRCPGGLPSLRRQALAAGIDGSTRVLEIGSNTGFTSIELVKMCGCRITGIEPNPQAVAEAKRRRALLPIDLQARVRFEVGDARDLAQADGTIDTVVCGGANSFIDGRDTAFQEYKRVLRPLGRVCITNFFYRTPPPSDLQDRMQAIIGVPIPPWDERQWLHSILDGSDWEVISLATHAATARSDEVVDRYVDHMVSMPQLDGLRAATRAAVRRRWLNVCATFNENMHHLGYFELVLRRPLRHSREQAPLFLGEGEYDRWFGHDIVTRKPGSP